MIIEALAHLFALDFGWFFGLVMNNLLWVFLFYAAANILDESKSFWGSIALFMFFAFDIFTEMSFSSATGWVFLGAEFLLILYLTRTAVSIWVETTPFLKKHLLKILTFHWLVIYVAYNLFLG